MNFITAIIAFSGLAVFCDGAYSSTCETIRIADGLEITRLSDRAFIHTSFLALESGTFPCNGLVYTDSREAIVFDTPVNDTGANALIKFIEDSLHLRIKAVVPTHFHVDCLGGLSAFHDRGIISYAHEKTLALAKKGGADVPKNGFRDSLKIMVGKSEVICRYFGEGHTVDNIIGWMPQDKLIFGGCLIKAMNAGKGNLADANVNLWPETVSKVKAAYPDVQTVIPGHGPYGGIELLDYTIRMFE